jgi:hypothetical protein
MQVDVETEITIQRPRQDVAAFSSNPDNAPLWYVNIESIEWVTPPPIRVGSKMNFVAHFLGRRIAYMYEAAELIPDERLVMRTAQGPFPMETTYTWISLAYDQTRMMLRNRGVPSGFSSLLAPIMAPAIRRANRKDLAALKRILESRNVP